MGRLGGLPNINRRGEEEDHGDKDRHRVVDLAHCKAGGGGSARIGDICKSTPNTMSFPRRLEGNEWFREASAQGPPWSGEGSSYEHGEAGVQRKNSQHLEVATCARESSSPPAPPIFPCCGPPASCAPQCTAMPCEVSSCFCCCCGPDCYCSPDASTFHWIAPSSRQ